MAAKATFNRDDPLLLDAQLSHGKVALRTSITGEVVMDGVFCPDENAFPEVRGLQGPFTCLDSARYGICWGALGAAEGTATGARDNTYSIASSSASRSPRIS